MSVEFCIGNGYSIDVEEYWRIQKYCRELKKENGVLKESLAREQSINAELIRRYETALSEASKFQLQSKKHIKDLERQMKNSSLEIGFLQDQLDIRNTQVNEKEAELGNMFLQIKKLESSVLSIQLESECEIEYLKHNITDLEMRYLEVERFSEQIAKEKVGSEILYTVLPTEILEARKKVDFLESENKILAEKLALVEQYMKMVFSEVCDYLDKWQERNQGHLHFSGEICHSLTLSLSSELLLMGKICECNFEEVVDPFLSKLAALLTWDENMESKLQKMSTQIQESELLLNQLKEGLRLEKSRAKEEAEDLAQEMAELRYQTTGLLEEECKHRSLIEQASLQRIHELEAEVRKLKLNHVETIKHSCEAHSVPKSRLVEIEELKKDPNRAMVSSSITSRELCNHMSTVSCSSSYGPNADGCFSVVAPACPESCHSWTSVVRTDQNMDCEPQTTINGLGLH